jgi:hypothetical protein
VHIFIAHSYVQWVGASYRPSLGHASPLSIRLVIWRKWETLTFSFYSFVGSVLIQSYQSLLINQFSLTDTPHYCWRLEYRGSFHSPNWFPGSFIPGWLGKLEDTSSASNTLLWSRCFHNWDHIIAIPPVIGSFIFCARPPTLCWNDNFLLLCETLLEKTHCHWPSKAVTMIDAVSCSIVTLPHSCGIHSGIEATTYLLGYHAKLLWMPTSLRHRANFIAASCQLISLRHRAGLLRHSCQFISCHCGIMPTHFIVA